MARVLVPVDGSAHDSKTLQFLHQLLAEKSDLQVTLLHVGESRTFATTGLEMEGMPVFLSATDFEAQQQRQYDAAKSILASAQAEAQRLGLNATGMVRWGDPMTIILQIIEVGTFDLVAMGSRGAGRIASIFLGSVSDRLAHRSQVPVLIVH